LLGHVGWRGLFFCFTIPGIIVASLLFALLPRTEPVRAPKSRFTASDLGLSKATTWLNVAAYFFFNAAFWGFNGWIPSYLREVRKLDLKELGFLAVPYLCGFAGMVVMGLLGSQRLFDRRPVLVGTCYSLAAVFFFVALKAHTTNGCVAGLSAAAFFLYGAFGPFWGAALDLAKDATRGAFSGFINFGGQVGSVVGQIVIGFVGDKMKSLNGALGVIILVLVIAACAMFTLQAVTLKANEPLPT
jgi:predicted MFS family arabinose efflux permease